MKIIIASKNPVKINATLQAFAKMFPADEWNAEGVDVASGVNDQPMSDEETYAGALNRTNAAKAAASDGDFWVGIEGGVAKDTHGMSSFAWVVVVDREGRVGQGKTSMFYLAKVVSDLIESGKELGEADDIVFKKENSKQQNGAVGLLTDDVITRTSYYVEATVFALIPFKNQEIYE